MADSFVNNKVIAKNTIFLYIRMLVIMLINLYTVRAYLSILGETDYGLYNVIGGVVAMFSFLNGTLATSSQRYFSQALVKGDKKSINNVFCLNLTIYALIAIIVVLFLETIGLWFVNTQLTIPTERLYAAHIVYQFSIITFVFQILSLSLTALVIAYERMKAFAYIGIAEALSRLLFVFVLDSSSCDKLVFYALFMLIIYVSICFIYLIYCNRNFPESRYHFYWNKKEATEMISFSGWHLLGTLSVVVRGQGVNLLLNMFFNPAVNTARAIAFQVEGAINRLSDNFFVAVKPQMYKSYSNREMEALNTLILRSSLICFFLVSILSIPFYFNAEYILGLWLKDVPQYTVTFTKLVLIGGLIDSLANSTICPALATGHIRKFYLVTGNLYILTLPISYFFLKLGFDPTSTMIISIVMSIIALFSRALLLVESIQFCFKNYMVLVMKLFFTTLLIGIVSFYVSQIGDNDFLKLLYVLIISSVLHFILYISFVCSPQDKNTILNIVKSKIHYNENNKKP